MKTMSNKGIKTLAKWGIIIGILGYTIERPLIAIPLILLALASTIIVKKLRKKLFRK